MIKILLFTIFFVALSVVSISAQGSMEEAVQNARDRFSDIKHRSGELERIKRDAEKAPERNDSTRKFPEIKEDFEQIQKINSDDLQPFAVKNPTNYAAFLKAVSELKHRAVRLHSNLFSFDSKEKNNSNNKKQIAGEQQDIKILLGNLDETINSFVHNSIFQNIKVVNPKDSLKAQNDLETIIKISSIIKEKIEKMSVVNSEK